MPVMDAAKAVYPRAYGEQADVPKWKNDNNGLSPCLRGTDNLSVQIRVFGRFIPVLTGNSPFRP